ncbi:unnamed protein product [Nippostrongylus brasiliensis]|uniref:KIF-binding protein n=1 Tax=Nippostrongylus brasiliensis TaxID=27835 RepID=A0A0N4YUJ8_NIPBR|nr:unnamed protein product [Nippostrongylus brasiliensis]
MSLLEVTSHLTSRNVDKREVNTTALEFVKEAEQSNRDAMELLRVDLHAVPINALRQAQDEMKKHSSNQKLAVLSKALQLLSRGTRTLTDATLPQNRPNNLEVYIELAAALYHLLQAVETYDVGTLTMEPLLRKVKIYALAHGYQPLKAAKAVAEISEVVVDGIKLQERIDALLSKPTL